MGGKLYSYILNKRLTQWIEDNKMLNEHKLVSDKAIVQSRMYSRS